MTNVSIEIAGDNLYHTNVLNHHTEWAGAAAGTTMFVNGYKMNGYLYFDDYCVVGHELQHILNFRYPQTWGTPDTMIQW